MDERKAFEEWGKSRQYDFEKDSEGEYAWLSTYEAWLAWKARAKLMLTLPVKDATGEH